MKPKVKQDLFGFVGITKYPDCVIESGRWITTVNAQYGTTTQQVKPKFYSDPDCGAKEYPYNWIQYEWTSTDKTKFKDYFEADWTWSGPSSHIKFEVTKACEQGKYRHPTTGKCLKLEIIPDIYLYGIDPSEDACYGKPIYPLQGAKLKDQSLGITIGGHEIRLVYDSMQRYRSNEDNSEKDSLFQPLTHSFDFGLFWASSLHKRVFVTKNAQGEVDGAQVNIGGGRFLRFLKNDGGKFMPTSSNAGFSLQEVASGFYLRDRHEGTLNKFNTDGKLTKLSYLDGQELTFAYSDESTPDTVAPQPGLMIKATDRSGRFVEFHYKSAIWYTDEENLVHPVVYRIIDANKRPIWFKYDEMSNPKAQARLLRVTWQDETFIDFGYEYPYNFPPPEARPWALTSITDEENQPYQSIAYDEAGAAISTELGGIGINKFTAAATSSARWNIASEGAVGDAWRRVLRPQAPTGLTVTAPNGQSSTLTTQTIGGTVRLKSRTQPAGAGCPASVSKASYDNSGNAIEKVTFGGKRSCSAFDTSRRLETVALTGLRSAEGCPDVPLAGYTIPNDKKLWRKTSSTWHPVWHLRTGEAKAGLITYWVYNGQPDPITGVETPCAPLDAKLPDGTTLPVLCKIIQQPTKDPNGSSEFAAAADGRSRTVEFAYDADGRLIRRIGAAGATDTVNFSYYDKTSFTDDRGHYKGDLKRVEDQNLFATTYDEYDLAGNITKVTMPNKETREFTYWPRGFLHTTERKSPVETVSLVETRDYWKTGQIKKVQQFNGDVVEYDYDTAHRHNWTSYNSSYVDMRRLRSSGKPDEVWTFDGRHVKYQYDALERVEKATELYMPEPWGTAPRSGATPPRPAGPPANPKRTTTNATGGVQQ